MCNDGIHRAPATGEHSWSFVWFRLLAVALLIAAPSSAFALEVDMEKVENALLKEDWKEVVNLLREVSHDPQKSPNPVLRLIKGHACLALNRNNESVCLFLSIRSQKERGRWLQWVREFAARHPDSAITHYFQGDAAARLHQWDRAITHYGNALKLNDAHVLVFNARGVVHAHQGELTKARLDFSAAVGYSDSRLADVYANIGVLRIQKRSGLQGALGAFDSALTISPTFVLALHGKACVKAANSQEITDAEKRALAVAVQDCPSTLLKKLMLANEERLAAFWDGRESEYFLAMLGAGEVAGTTIDSNVSNPFESYQNDVRNGHGMFEMNRNQFLYNQGLKAFSEMPVAEQLRVAEDVKAFNAESAMHQNAFNRNNGEVVSHNEHGGQADDFNQNLATASAAIAAGAGIADIEPISKAALVAGGLGGVHGAGQLQSNRNKYHQTAMELDGLVNSGETASPSTDPVGGVDMNLADVHRAPSMWPFIGYYALAYDIAKFQRPFAQPQAEESPPADDAAGTNRQGVPE